MRYLFVFILSFLLPILLMAQEDKKVLVIGIDGCRADALEQAETPHIDDLISSGIYSPDALNDDITISGPGWSAILCGVWSDKHLVLDNGFSEDDYESYPSFHKRINDFDADLHTVSICHWAPINDIIVGDHADFSLNVTSDIEVANQAASYLSINDPDLMFLHFDEVDYAGHAYGFSPGVDLYREVIEHVDSLVGIVIEAVESRPNYSNEDWLIIITSDHGGIGTNHGGSTIEEKNVFMLVSGKNTSASTIVKDSSLLIQNIMNCLADSVELDFDGQDDNVSIPFNPLFDFGTDQDFTVECRIRTSSSSDVSIVGNKDWDSGSNKGFVFSFKYPSGPEWKVNIGDGVSRADIDVGGEIADGEWHTLSVSFDRDGPMKMYQDGVFLDSLDISFIDDINSNSGLFFGSDINAAYAYSGSIAEVRIWDSVLEEEKINDWYCTSVNDSHPNYSNLIGHWKLNEGTESQEAIDYSTYANSGTVNGAEWIQPDSVFIYDYTNTPRLTDVVSTALTHMCIPINPSWSLDGSSLVSECQNTSSTIVPYTSHIEMLISPNPSSDEINIKLNAPESYKNFDLEIYNSNGIRLKTYSFSTHIFKLDVSKFSPGVYHFKLIGEKKNIVTQKVILN